MSVQDHLTQIASASVAAQEQEAATGKIEAQLQGLIARVGENTLVSAIVGEQTL